MDPQNSCEFTGKTVVTLHFVYLSHLLSNLRLILHSSGLRSEVCGLTDKRKRLELGGDDTNLIQFRDTCWIRNYRVCVVVVARYISSEAAEVRCSIGAEWSERRSIFRLNSPYLHPKP